MAFFDDFSRKISQAGQGAAQSAKNFAAVTKLNSMISEEEKKADNLYYQLGKAYFGANSECPDANFVGYVNAITEALNNIEQYKEQIKETKGITNCPNCGAEVSYTSSFCNSCGTKMPQMQQYYVSNDNGVKCSNCGNFVPAGYKFCTSCGNVMGVPADEPEVTAASDSESSAKCPNCGKEITPGAMFCTGCGQQL